MLKTNTDTQTVPRPPTPPLHCATSGCARPREGKYKLCAACRKRAYRAQRRLVVAVHPARVTRAFRPRSKAQLPPVLERLMPAIERHLRALSGSVTLRELGSIYGLKNYQLSELGHLVKAARLSDRLKAQPWARGNKKRQADPKAHALLQEWRANSDRTVAALARELGVHERTLLRWLAGRIAVPTEVAARLRSESSSKLSATAKLDAPSLSYRKLARLLDDEFSPAQFAQAVANRRAALVAEQVPDVDGVLERWLASTSALPVGEAFESVSAALEMDA